MGLVGFRAFSDSGFVCLSFSVIHGFLTLTLDQARRGYGLRVRDLVRRDEALQELRVLAK